MKDTLALRNLIASGSDKIKSRFFFVVYMVVNHGHTLDEDCTIQRIIENDGGGLLPQDVKEWVSNKKKIIMYYCSVKISVT